MGKTVTYCTKFCDKTYVSVIGHNVRILTWIKINLKKFCSQGPIRTVIVAGNNLQ